MYISKIVPVRKFGQHNGLTFGTRDELTTAIRTLGYMLIQPEAAVDTLISRMLNQLKIGMARSGLLAVLMGNDSEPAGPVVGSGTVTRGGWVIGARFSEHNTYGLPQREPFMGHSLRIMREENANGGDCYRLTVTDKVSSTSLDPTRVGLCHTESLLAAQLGRPRPLSSMLVCTFYEQAGPNVEFGLVPILDALASINGLAKVSDSPEEIAEGYFAHMRDDNFDDLSHQVRLTHDNGCTVVLLGVYGIQERSDTIGRQLLLRRDGNQLLGPYARIYGKIGPFAEFGVYPPKIPNAAELTPEAVLATNRLLSCLAEELTTTLWTNNVG